MHFPKKKCHLSSTDPVITAFGSHCLPNLKTILNWLIPDVKLTYGDSENIKTDRVNTVVFNLL